MLFKAGCLLEVLSLAVFSTHVHIMVQKIYFGSLFVAKFYFAFSRQAYFVVTYGSFYGSQFSPSYGSSHIFGCATADSLCLRSVLGGVLYFAVM